MTIGPDVHYVLRSLRRSPGLSLVIVLSLGLGIGINTAMFSFIEAALLRPLPFRDPGRLVVLWEHNTVRGVERNVVNPQNYLDWRDRATSFTGLALVGWSSTTFTGEAPEVVRGRTVTAGFFELLGVPPALGRWFTPDESRPGGPRLVVLSHALWRRRFGADAGVIGRAVPVAGGQAVVIGVMPPDFQAMPFGDDQYWEPFRLDQADRTRNGRYALVVGRLKAGVSLDAARQEMAGIARDLAREYPDFDTGWGVTMVPLREQLVGSVRPVLWMLLGAVAVVLLIACANVANLLLSRAAGRRQELTVRAALGAPRWRLIRLHLVESLVMGIAGGGLGVLLAWWGLDLLVALAPAETPWLRDAGLNPLVLGVTALVTIVVALVFGLPAALAETGTPRGQLAVFGTRTTGGPRAARLRAIMVVTQVSLALVLSIGAGLLIRSVARLGAVDPGFDPANLLTLSLELPAAAYHDGGEARFYEQLLTRIRELPGVERAGAVSFLPLTSLGAATGYHVVGRPLPKPGQVPGADIRIVDPDYFTTMRIPLRRGRGFDAGDRGGAPPVVVITESLAREMFPGVDPIGQRLQVSWTDPTAEPEIVGVVGDVRYHGLDGLVRSMIYYPLPQNLTGSMALVIRAVGDRATLVAAVRRLVRDLDPELPVTEVASMQSWRERSMADRRYPMLLLAGFAGLALLLAAVGLYGVVTHGVTLRTREFGVRAALGATPAELISLVLRGGARLALIGTGLGLAAAGATSRLLGHLLYQVSPADPVTYLATAAALMPVVLLATGIPAWRAARADPIAALRAE